MAARIIDATKVVRCLANEDGVEGKTSDDFTRCMAKINKMNHGDVSADDLETDQDYAGSRDSEHSIRCSHDTGFK
ncbi:hypothetical protein C5167_018826 [Papaver somniferum]|uniref:Uncharacterized protein n=1 Tax=Papaver somniferum TaxID=3469 RepID=A0A4Y7IRR1_PAPSO|nr:hypothetical protein C5167_018826 [Papaver somniferum]